jgi:hypothetical protein
VPYGDDSMEAMRQQLALLSQQIEWREQTKVGLEMMARVHRRHDGRERSVADRLAESIERKRRQVRQIREVLTNQHRRDH